MRLDLRRDPALGKRPGPEVEADQHHDDDHDPRQPRAATTALLLLWLVVGQANRLPGLGLEPPPRPG